MHPEEVGLPLGACGSWPLSTIKIIMDEERRTTVNLKGECIRAALVVLPSSIQASWTALVMKFTPLRKLAR